MKARTRYVAWAGWAVAAVLLIQFGLRAQPPQSVRPAALARMQNLGVTADESRKPVYLPREWGYLVHVEKTGGANYTLFLQSTTGEIYLVRLLQSGDYLYLDTYDKGGVALVIPREP